MSKASPPLITDFEGNVVSVEHNEHEDEGTYSEEPLELFVPSKSPSVLQGTRITFQPDLSRFSSKEESLSKTSDMVDIMKSRCVDVAACNPKVWQKQIYLFFCCSLFGLVASSVQWKTHAQFV